MSKLNSATHISSHSSTEIIQSIIMKLFVVLALVAVAAAAPQTRTRRQSNQDIQTLRYDAENDGLGTYNFAFEQSDGQRQEQRGELRNAGSDNEFIAVKGSYFWVGPDGVTYNVNYVADDQGYQPTIEQGPGGGVPPGVVASLLGG